MNFKNLNFIFSILLLLPSRLLASEVSSILEGLEQLLFIGLIIVVASLIPLFIYIFKRKQATAKLLFVIGGIAVFAGFLMTSSRGQEIESFGSVLIILGLLNIMVPLFKKPL